MSELGRTDLIPTISLGLVVLAFFVSGFDYYLIQEGAVLLFYAVLVRIWTSLEENPEGYLTGSEHLDFLLMAAGAVVLGRYIEWVVEWISGDLIAAQSLALAVLVSRFYVNTKTATDWRDILGIDDPVDRYAVLAPCLFVLLLPALLYQIHISPILGFDPYSLTERTRDGFLTLVLIAILFGAVLYGRIEEGWSLS